MTTPPHGGYPMTTPPHGAPPTTTPPHGAPPMATPPTSPTVRTGRRTLLAVFVLVLVAAAIALVAVFRG
jgi:hypothetical protein